MHGTLVPTAPGDEPAALASLVGHADHGIDATAVILVGERLATVPGALTAAADLAARTGARLAWVPRRAGDRGAVETGCLPNLLPGGRPVADAGARVDAAAAWGVDEPARPRPAATATPSSPPSAPASWRARDRWGRPRRHRRPGRDRGRIAAADFVVALDLRASDVTRAADVVFPVAPADRQGRLLRHLGGSRRVPFDRCSATPPRCPTCASWPASPRSSAPRLGFRTVAEVWAQLEQMGPWDGERATMTPVAAGTASAPRPTGPVWSCRPGSSSSTRAPCRTATSTSPRPPAPPCAKVGRSRSTTRVGPTVTVTGDRGSVTLPAEVVADLVDGVVWLPANSAAAACSPTWPHPAPGSPSPEETRDDHRSDRARAAGTTDEIAGFGDDPWWVVLSRRC